MTRNIKQRLATY